MALTTVILPVKNEDHSTLVKILYELEKYGFETIVVDDGSDEPVIGADVRFIPPGKGYGAALKKGIELANTDLVATMDSDGQHAVWDVKRLEDFMIYFHDNRIDLGHINPDLVIGDRRIREKSWKRFWGRKFLNWIATIFTRKWIPDLNSGLRIFKRNIAIGYFPILCNGFSFTTSLTLAMMADGYCVEWIPIKVWPRYHGTTKVKMWKDGLITLRTIFWIGMALRTRRIRAWLRSRFI